jgi:hypothetical protein
MPKGLGKPVRLGAIRRCCARGRAHSAVAYPAALAVNQRKMHLFGKYDNTNNRFPILPPMLGEFLSVEIRP